MFSSAVKIVSSTRGHPRCGGSWARLSRVVPLLASARSVQDRAKDNGDPKERFDTSLLEFLVCPLSKKALRYDEKTNELINDDLGIAYPVIDGIPNMIPQDARMIRSSSDQGVSPQP
ncbi:protein preY, mitochondrial-like [Brienomyrus brachyistius]|uniref:protein preY, mitochondrial-like n=1 Tax=Brienomyrus brachyistius TaxID=42636 RepID=UPI0020B2CD43|nr:protein preY, mitochondrial-like [Brienomyrus brachyistius]